MLRRHGKNFYNAYRRIQGERYPSELDSRAVFNFHNPDDPNYKPAYYGIPYTDRQYAILQDQIPLDEVPLNQLTILMKKAESLEDKIGYEKASLLRTCKLELNKYKPQMSVPEAVEVLQQLTPWSDK